jgi:hypothetical protein
VFASSITRPLRWAIPVAVAAGLFALFWFFRPLEVDVDGVTVNCRQVAVFDQFGENPCSAEQRERFLLSGLILAAGVLPLVVVVVRACVVSADTIASLREDIQRLHERLDRLER